MSDEAPKVLAVVGSLNDASGTKVLVSGLLELLAKRGCETDLLDYAQTPLELFDPDTSYSKAGYETLKARVERANVIVLGTPDYHGCMSGATKNFLDHFWTEFAGKLFASIVMSFEKGLTVADQIRTAARQCYAWSLPYAVSATEGADVRDGEIVSEGIKQRLEMMARDLVVYGSLLAKQRHEDLEGDEIGFLARYRDA